MKKLLLATTFALLSLGLVPATSSAFWNSPQSSAGFGWLGSVALKFCPGSNFEGPLFNYGPYDYGYAYQFQYVQGPHHGGYIPAYPSTYQQSIYNYTGGQANPWLYGYPQQNGVQPYPTQGYPAPANYSQPPLANAPVAAPKPIASSTPPVVQPTAATTTTETPTIITTSSGGFRSRFRR